MINSSARTNSKCLNNRKMTFLWQNENRDKLDRKMNETKQMPEFELVFTLSKFPDNSIVFKFSNELFDCNLRFFVCVGRWEHEKTERKRECECLGGVCCFLYGKHWHSFIRTKP